MPAISNDRLNIIEWSKKLHKGKVLPEIKMLAQQNQVLMHIPFRMANDGTTHLYRMQTGLPTVSKTMWGEGAPDSKGQSAQDREHTTMLQGFSTVEEEMAKVGGQMSVVRAEEDENFAESMRQTFAGMLFYDNHANNERDINGFATRFNALGGVKGKNVIDCGGTTPNAQTSIYIANFGRDVYGIFPEGTTAGYEKENLGRQVQKLPNGNNLVVQQTWHKWHVGLVVEAWQSVVRLCNIEVAHALALSNNQSPTGFLNVLHRLVQARLRIRRPGKRVVMVNETIFGLMMRLALEKSFDGLKVEEAVTQFGSFERMRLFGMEVVMNDQILDTEPRVV